MITVKTAAEIEAMREPCAITRDVLDVLGRSLREGMTTAALDKIAFEFIKDSGAEPAFLGYCGYPASACISLDDMVVHGIPDEKTYIESGVIVSIDVGAVKNGFVGDAARSFYIGDISAEKKKLIDVTRECFFKAIEDLGDGSPLGDIGYRVQKHAEENGFSVVREMVGHGVGRKMHEDPSVPNYGKRGTGIRLKAGMTLAIEPMINMGERYVNFLSDGWGVATKDGKPSAHYENTVLITETGTEILTL
ncbi:MAG: type I methionyl aminopeptidase [Bacillota bacterium]|nr:MAG: type I methionyl aminopeptidase [Bacillota bacterium]